MSLIDLVLLGLVNHFSRPLIVIVSGGMFSVRSLVDEHRSMSEILVLNIRVS